jgi:hypothetical protein
MLTVRQYQGQLKPNNVDAKTYQFLRKLISESIMQDSSLRVAGLHTNSLQKINESIKREHRVLVSQGRDFRSKIIQNIALDIYKSNNGKYSLRESVIISEGILDKVTSYFGKAAKKLQGFKPNSFTDWDGLSDSLEKEEVFQDIDLNALGSQEAKEKFAKNIKRALDLSQDKIRDEASTLVKDFLQNMNTDVDEINNFDSGEETAAKEVNKFPLVTSKKAFFQGVIDIAAFYDSLVSDAQKNPEKTPVNNTIINLLRRVVEAYADKTEKEAGGVYRYFGGGKVSGQEKNESRSRSLSSGRYIFENISKKRLSHSDFLLLESINKIIVKRNERSVNNNIITENYFKNYFGKSLNEAGRVQGDGDPNVSGVNRLAANQGGENIKDIINKHNLRGPIITMVAGALLAIVGRELSERIGKSVAELLENSDNVKSPEAVKKFVANAIEKTNTISVSDTGVNVQRGDALSIVMRELNGGEALRTTGDAREFFTNYGNGNFNAGVNRFASAYGSGASEASEHITRSLSGASPDSRISGTLFNSQGLGSGDSPISIHPSMSFPGMPIPVQIAIKIAEKVAVTVGKAAAKKAVVGAAVSAAGASGLSAGAAVASALAPLGIAIATGAAVTLALRMYGNAKSRSKTLQDLYNILKLIDNKEEKPTPDEGEKSTSGPGSGPKKSADSGSNLGPDKEGKNNQDAVADKDDAKFAVALFSDNGKTKVYRMVSDDSLRNKKPFTDELKAAYERHSGTWSWLDRRDDDDPYIPAEDIQLMKDISTGPIGSVVYDKEKNKKFGGYSEIDKPASEAQIRSKLAYSNGEKPADSETLDMVYLVDPSVLKAVQKAGKISAEKSKKYVSKVIAHWRDARGPAKAKKKTDGQISKISRSLIDSGLMKESYMRVGGCNVRCGLINVRDFIAINNFYKLSL